ncbi:flagellar biosynthesis regulator FlaF [Sphingomonas morindae]|uniref:Flagellar biosynthesis regulator FlaF n=1 Tax=Sphingomonas morindae TaxID=1541170 RepID=A0ABY4X516_9SPHN|nr:flagellar biosynthesis regulator FlaF [Sphingomonas morindae]USI71999.1 flagellar biosynthesis regulator FlaF [Sphingomonas morindae]
MSLDAYRQARVFSETPRAVEYRLVSEITRDLVQARDTALRGGALMALLARNREMWLVFSAACEDDANGLPVALRAGIISLALWVDRHTSAVMRGHETVEPLIDVNRAVMAGLAGEGAAPSPSEARTAA